MTLHFRRGILVFVSGLPTFLGLRVFLEWVFGRAVDLRYDIVWASIMALTFGVMGLFVRDDKQ